MVTGSVFVGLNSLFKASFQGSWTLFCFDASTFCLGVVSREVAIEMWSWQVIKWQRQENQGFAKDFSLQSVVGNALGLMHGAIQDGEREKRDVLAEDKDNLIGKRKATHTSKAKESIPRFHGWAGFGFGNLGKSIGVSKHPQISRLSMMPQAWNIPGISCAQPLCCWGGMSPQKGLGCVSPDQNIPELPTASSTNPNQPHTSYHEEN